ncbi:hypothetical protein GCM10010168_24110 [Actinoplanes ianthinogenes]|uniref:Uncharacterized protein n=1 Tax=Actinoplanes ianthinogenes TaxID=122358 RepID=A0ABM7M8X5_9ACTN|nr:hypothetical protein [Actinoplanes ianthinogenes]BCJ48051.1 hypothetical protein Aiant_87080 [Actinoplanes ianthinogenes]GGR06054.1 hypothetical protein GCM10010168_24110 [Actinoplanes ianthinogenes]
MAPEREPGGLPDLQRAATYAGVALTVFTLLKVYAVAYFSVTTAAALLTTAPINVFLTSMVSVSYQLFPLLALALLAYAAEAWRSSGLSTTVISALGVAAVAVCVSPWVYLWQVTLFVVGVRLSLFVLVLASDAVATLLQRPARFRPRVAVAVRQAAARQWRRLITLRMLPPTLLIAVLAILLQTMTDLWLPAEVVVYAQGSPCAMTIAADVIRAPGCRQVVGHVLSDTGPWTSVVTAGDRRLHRIPTDGIRYRGICHLTGVQLSGARPLLWVVERRRYTSPNLSCERLSATVQGAAVDPGSLP